MLSALSGKSLTAPPFWFMRQAGRYLPEYLKVRSQAGSFLNLCYNPELAAEVTLQPIRRFGMSAAIIFSDILVVPHALGQDVSFVQNEGPKLGLLDIASLDFKTKKLSPVFEALKLVSAALPADVALIGFCGSPWTVATYMVEGGSSKNFAATKKMAYLNPTHFAQLIDIITNSSIEYLKQQILAGAEVIQLFDSWAGELPEEEFEKWVVAPTAKIVAELKAFAPDIKIIGFPRKAGVLAKAYLATKVDCISIDNSVTLKWALDNLPVTLQGGLDPVLLQTDHSTIKHHATKVLQTVHGHPFIFNVGHGIIKETPIHHIEQLMACLRR
mgnify:CR=1 FL=1